VIFCKLYGVKQLLYTADFSKEVLSSSHPFNEVLVEELYLEVGREMREPKVYLLIRVDERGI
jgi:hypothetical protein